MERMIQGRATVGEFTVSVTTSPWSHMVEIYVFTHHGRTIAVLDCAEDVWHELAEGQAPERPSLTLPAEVLEALGRVWEDAPTPEHQSDSARFERMLEAVLTGRLRWNGPRIEP